MNPDFFEKRLDGGAVSFQRELNNLSSVTRCYTGNVEIVDNVTRASQVLSSLKGSTELALDCEGVNLGRGGKLTLLQMGKYRGTVYLFDVLKLGESLFSIGMKEILESDSIAKYMFDCKSDSDSLYHEYGVKLANVLDMQIFEYVVRPFSRRPLPHPPSRPEHYNAPIVRGLSYAVKTYVKRQQIRRIGLEDFFELKGAGSKVMQVEQTLWRYRPLSEGMKKYAALDIEMIWIVADTLKACKPLTGITMERVKIGSDVYTAMRRDADVKPDNVYIRHPVLVSFVIPEVDRATGRIKQFPYADTKCNGCRRYFEASFVTRQRLCKDCVEVVRVNKHRTK